MHRSGQDWLSTFWFAALTTVVTGCGGGGGPVSSLMGTNNNAPTLPATSAPESLPASNPLSAPSSSFGAQGLTLVWSDEFEVAGLPDGSKWNYDTERNKLGWYNNEKQYYASARLQNSDVTNGVLSINAIRESLTSATDFGGQAFTSARLITRGNFSFTYGFVEVRAKMPCALGTWPAIWMLGTGGKWPEDGEIDLLEQRGTRTLDKAEVLGTVHSRAYNWSNGTLGVAKGATQSLPTACTEFHNYQLNWTPDILEIGVDGVVYNTVTNPKLSDESQNYLQWPFNKPQYLILNVAMGGDLGGTVPSSFSRDAMQVEYVRVYKN